jgi:hypothetical protein
MSARDRARFVVGLMLAIGLGFLAAAYFSYVDQNTGPVASARIGSCHGTYGAPYGSGVTCRGSWVTGGALVGGSGHVVVGDVHGADYGDIGHTIGVHLHGDNAYPTKHGLRVPIVSAVLGLIALIPALRAVLFGIPDRWVGGSARKPTAG